MISSLTLPKLNLTQEVAVTERFAVQLITLQQKDMLGLWQHSWGNYPFIFHSVYGNKGKPRGGKTINIAQDW